MKVTCLAVIIITRQARCQKNAENTHVTDAQGKGAACLGGRNRGSWQAPHL